MKTSAFNDPMRTSTVGLVAGFVLFLGLGCFVLFGWLSSLPGMFHPGMGLLFRALCVVFLAIGFAMSMSFLAVAVRCWLLLQKKRELKRWLKERTRPQLPPPVLPQEFTLEWSLAFLRAAMQRQFLSTFSGILMFFAVVALVCIAVLVAPGDRGSSATWLLLGICLIVVLLVPFIWLARSKGLKMKVGRKIKLRVEADTLTVQTEDRSTTLKWSAIRSESRFPGGLRLNCNSCAGPYLPLPLEPLGEQTIRFIENKVNENRGQSDGKVS